MLKKIFGKIHSKKQRTQATEEVDTASEIDRYLNELNQRQQKTISLLLLGIGACGKSTVCKQLQKVYSDSIPNETLKNATVYIKQNILKDIHHLSIQNMILNISNTYLHTISIDLNLFIPLEIVNVIRMYYNDYSVELSSDSQIICTKLASLKDEDLEETELTQDLAKEISILWNDKGLHETFNILKRHHIMDNAPYLFENIFRIAHPAYIANFEDYIRFRHATTGIIEEEFDIDTTSKWRMKVTDVGGMRSERKKWLRCFTDIHAIIYVMALDGYDKRLFEDDTTNCYQESLDVFEVTMKHEALETIDVIIFFNKNDLFVSKIEQIPFSVFDPNFNKELVHNEDAVKDYLRNEYKKRFYNEINADKSQRRIHFHVLCAIDTRQIQWVMHQIQFQTVRKIMRVGMLL